MPRPANVDEAMQRLQEPFPPDCISWRPADFKTTVQHEGKPHSPAVPYLDARAVQTRLDNVFGADGWYPRYAVMPGGEVECQLYARFPGSVEFIMKPDVGKRMGVVDKKDGGEEELKAGYTEAFKRAAVLFGIGRYLYSIPYTLAPSANNGRQLTASPRLPEWALPEDYRMSGSQLAGEFMKVAREVSRVLKREEGAVTAEFLDQHDYRKDTPVARVQRRHLRAWLKENVAMLDAAPLPAEMPQTGQELLDRLGTFDAKLAKADRCKPGDLIGYVAECGTKAGFGTSIRDWGKSSQIRTAVGWASEFEKAHPARPQEKNTAPAKTAEAGNPH